MSKTIKLGIVLTIITILVSTFWYISGLRADIQRSQSNVVKLENAINQQEEVIQRIQEEQEQISQK